LAMMNLIACPPLWSNIFPRGETFKDDELISVELSGWFPGQFLYCWRNIPISTFLKTRSFGPGLSGPFEISPKVGPRTFFFNKRLEICPKQISLCQWPIYITHFHSTIIFLLKKTKPTINFKAFHGQEVDDIFAPAPAQAIRDCVGCKGGRCC